MPWLSDCGLVLTRGLGGMDFGALAWQAWNFAGQAAARAAAAWVTLNVTVLDVEDPLTEQER